LKNKSLTIAGFALALWIGLSHVFPCGPFFPNTLLDRGDDAIMTAPEARFYKELERMKLVSSKHRAIPTTNHPRQTFDAELADLAAALEKARVPAAESKDIVQRHRAERRRIAVFDQRAPADAAAPANSPATESVFVLRPQPTNAARITGPLPRITPGLPGEFADYFRGSVAWHQCDFNGARQAWTSLLARPPQERPFKSTWAAFMLGKSWEDSDRAKAGRYFQMVRQLTSAGFADSLGLAASSLGWEARCDLRDRNLAKAIDLYLEQAASGDASAVVSLRWTAELAITQSPSKLKSLAAHLSAQRVITAYVISGGFRDPPMDTDPAVREAALRLLEKTSSAASFVPAPNPAWHRLERPVDRWLKAVEDAKVKDVDSAEQIALAAYQAGQMDAAQRWLNRAKPTPVAQWLQAKLHLRDGKVEAAAALLSKLSVLFPVQPRETNRLANARLVDSLYLQIGVYDVVSVAEQLRGELGVFRLARRQYTEALEALLQSGYWIDAAYVAERVLTLDELKAYVDRHWPASSGSAEKSPDDAAAEKQATDESTTRATSATTGERLRYLLARRLARANRRNEARAYYPPAWLPQFDKLAEALQDAEKAELPQVQRAQAYFAAAQLTRQVGLELAGTEVEPDWHVYEGNFQAGVTVADRISLVGSNALAASSEELSRVAQHAANPEQRFHYRYTAAALAWESAKLMPNNADDTARVLCLAGTWLKNRDPIAADVFYKALVRRCRKTAVGAEADRLRWFPKVDTDGNLVPRETPAVPVEEQEKNSELKEF
jgi:hypothetical protein